jgi:hypothetical protein
MLIAALRTLYQLLIDLPVTHSVFRFIELNRL